MSEELSQDRYELFERLGEGGMAEVFLARDLRLGRKVVIKRLKPELTGNRQLVRMFVDEARIIAQLNHPRIITIHALGYQDGRPFMVLEWLKGWDLSFVFARSSKLGTFLPLEWVLSVLVDACIGLHAAHTARTSEGEPLRLVHRDISPHNLFITTRGRLKILDFGVAKASIQQEKTQAGTIKGKYSYMSPEQLSAQPLDRRSDVFSLGIVLHELLTGRPLFDQGTFVELFEQITAGQTPPPVRPGSPLPQSLIAATSRALNRKPELRFASAREFGRALQGVLARLNVRVPSPLQRARFVNDLVAREPDTMRRGSDFDLTTTRIAVGRLQVDERGADDDMRRLRARKDATRASELVFDDLEEEDDFALDTARLPFSSDRSPSGSWTVITDTRFWQRISIPVAWSHLALAFTATASIVVLALMISRWWGGESGSPEPDPAAMVSSSAGEAESDKSARPVVELKTTPAPRRFPSPPEPPPRVAPGVTVDPPPRAAPKAKAQAAPRRRSQGSRAKRSASQSEAKARRFAYLTLETVPWVEVFWRKQSLGPTPIINQKFPAGLVELRLVNPKYDIDTKRSFTLSEGETLRRKIPLIP